MSANTILVSLQCSEGRFEGNIDIAASMKEVKRTFKKSVSAFADVNMNAFIVSYKGRFITEEGTTLKAVGATSPTVLILVKRQYVPALNVPDDKE